MSPFIDTPTKLINFAFLYCTVCYVLCQKCIPDNLTCPYFHSVLMYRITSICLRQSSAILGREMHWRGVEHCWIYRTNMNYCKPRSGCWSDALVCLIRLDKQSWRGILVTQLLFSKHSVTDCEDERQITSGRDVIINSNIDSNENSLWRAFVRPFCVWPEFSDG